MGRTRSPVEDLRLAIDCLPLRTREAMLEGIRARDHRRRLLRPRRRRLPDARRPPLRRAHDFISFAHAWDRFARAKRARAATARELRVLEAQLDASILAEATTRPRRRDRRAPGARRASARPTRPGASALGWLRRRDERARRELV